MRDCIEARIS